jgi:THO complex subunit 2
MVRISASRSEMASKIDQGKSLYLFVLELLYNVAVQCFIDCILTGEFMHVYNAIVVMKEILDVFPLVSVNDCGAAVNSAINRLVESEERGDLKILARS